MTPTPASIAPDRLAGWREIKVTLGISDEEFPCLVRLGDGRQPMTDTRVLGWEGDPIMRWNGFVAYPLFDQPTVERIIEWCKREGAPDQIEWDGSVVLLSSTDYPDDPPERIEPTDTPLGPRWCVGGCSWTWSEVRDE